MHSPGTHTHLTGFLTVSDLFLASQLLDGLMEGLLSRIWAALWKACIYLQLKCCLSARKSAAFSPAICLTLNDHTSLRNNYLQSSATKPSAWWIDLHRRHECILERQKQCTTIIYNVSSLLIMIRACFWVCSFLFHKRKLIWIDLKWIQLKFRK